jgi:hypothetical protein
MPGKRLMERVHAVSGFGDLHEREAPRQHLMERLAIGRIVFGDKHVDHRTGPNL